MAGHTLDYKPVLKRRISREPEQAKPKSGQDCTSEFMGIVERVVSEKGPKGTMEVLKERMKLLKLMLEDCCALVKRKKEACKKKRRHKRLERFLPCVYVTVAVAVGIFGVLATWFLVQIKPEGAVSL